MISIATIFNFGNPFLSLKKAKNPLVISIYVLFSTSTPDSNYLNVPYLDRGTNYICVMVIKEDEDNFYFDCFNQIDININIPIEFIENNLLYKVKNFFDKYFEFLNVLK